MTVDLTQQKITTGSSVVPFEVDAERRRRLIEGIDDIALSLAHLGEIETFERTAALVQPWVGPIPKAIGAVEKRPAGGRVRLGAE
ncbi:hypothetical protein [Sphingobium sp. LB126]|nr:hypothetical protein [Sphingobium sp. LB126]